MGRREGGREGEGERKERRRRGQEKKRGCIFCLSLLFLSLQQQKKGLRFFSVFCSNGKRKKEWNQKKRNGSSWGEKKATAQHTSHFFFLLSLLSLQKKQQRKKSFPSLSQPRIKFQSPPCVSPSSDSSSPVSSRPSLRVSMDICFEEVSEVVFFWHQSSLFFR